MSNIPRFEVFEGADDNFYFHLKAGNGRIILQSEGYETKSAAKRGAESVRRNARFSQSEITEKYGCKIDGK